MKTKLVKSMNMSDIIKAKLEQNAIQERKCVLEEGMENAKRYEEDRDEEEKFEVIKNAEYVQSEYFKFCKNLKTNLLCEALNKIYYKSIPIKDISRINNVNYINEYVETVGAEQLLSSFKCKTVLLSEVSRLVNKYHSKIMENVKKDDIDTHQIDDKIKDEFIDELDNTEVDKVSDVIKDRVQNGLEEFVQDTANDNAQVRDIIDSGKKSKDINIIEPSEFDAANDTELEINEDEPEEIDKSENVEESYTEASRFNKHINDIRAKRNQSVFEMMIVEIAKKSFTDTSIKESSSIPSIEFIIENTLPMYTFLEMLNTLKIENINEEYILNLQNDLKK